MSTPFQRKVYRAVRKIPPGYVTTYRILACHIHCKSCRAVGQALKHNPYAPSVPCHRVIASDLSPGGFKGSLSSSALRLKKKLLVQEGVKFQNNKLADKKRLFHNWS